MSGERWYSVRYFEAQSEASRWWFVEQISLWRASSKSEAIEYERTASKLGPETTIFAENVRALPAPRGKKWFASSSEILHVADARDLTNLWVHYVEDVSRHHSEESGNEHRWWTARIITTRAGSASISTVTFETSHESPENEAQLIAREISMESDVQSSDLVLISPSRDLSFAGRSGAALSRLGLSHKTAWGQYIDLPTRDYQCLNGGVRVLRAPYELNDDLFWKTISVLNRESDQDALQRLEDFLSQNSTSFVLAFSNTLSQRVLELLPILPFFKDQYGWSHHSYGVRGQWVREWVIVQGKDLFDQIVESPRFPEGISWKGIGGIDSLISVAGKVEAPWV